MTIVMFSPGQKVKMQHEVPLAQYIEHARNVNLIVQYVDGEIATVVEPYVDSFGLFGEAYWLKLENASTAAHPGYPAVDLHIAVWSKNIVAADSSANALVDESCCCGALKTWGAQRGSYLHNQDYCSWFARTA